MEMITRIGKKCKLSALLCCIAPLMAYTQMSAGDKKLDIDCRATQDAFIRKDSLMRHFFDHAAAYAIFPNIGKGGLLIGGAMGKGIVYQKGKPIASSRLKQVSAGLQAGGQTFSEVIFFQDEAAFKRFREGHLELSASVSGVLLSEGAAAQSKYQDGIMVFFDVKGGLMFEMSLSGQKFDYNPF